MRWVWSKSTRMEVRAGSPATVGRLLEGLMLGGFAMQSTQSSRPASGAEHQFSHLWDMQHHTHLGRAPSHGFKVGIGTLAVTALYEELLRQPIEALDVDRCCAAWPDLDDSIAQARTLLRQDELCLVADQEITAKHCDRDQLRFQLGKLRDTWPELRERLQRQLPSLVGMQEQLLAVGAPIQPEEIGITRERLRRSYWEAYCIRRRFTVLDLAVRTGLLEACLERIFGPLGPWPILDEAAGKPPCVA
jgi:glycerol-1-phosphate dehydrogenase [NAD(P)+]